MGLQKLPRDRTNVSIYKYDKVVLQLEYCQEKLRRHKLELRNLMESNARLRALVSEEIPMAIKPSRFLKHAARHLRVVEGESGAVHLLFKIAGMIDKERSRKEAIHET
jgi:hypothetical protein